MKAQNLNVTSKKKKNKKRLWIPIIAIFCVIAVATAAVIMLFPHVSTIFVDNSAEDYRNPYNMIEGTYVARNDSYIFYINSNGAVVRMDKDLGNRKVVVDGKSVDIIYLSGKTLYYHDSEQNYIYTSDMDGNDEQQLVSMKTCWFTIVGEQLYFLEGYSVWDYENERADTYGEFALYKATLSGTDYEKIIPYSASRISIQDDSIVYYNNDDNTIYAIALDGTGERELRSNNNDDRIYSYKVYKNKLYYTIYNTQDENVSGIYRIDLTTRDEEKIVSTIPGEFTFWEDSLIYVSDSNSSASATHICQLDGSQDEVLFEETFRQPLVMGDYLYYRSSALSSTISVYNLKTKESDAFEMRRYTEMAFTDDYIFYIDSEDDNIYRCDHDGKNVVKLTNSYCSSVYMYDGNLYYYGYANGYDPDNRETPSGIFPSGFLKLDINGEGCVAVELNGNRSVIFHDNYIYYPSSYDSHIYRTRLDNIDTDETNRPYIRATRNDHFSTPFFIADNWLYLYMWKNDTNTLSRVSLDGSSTQTFINNYPYDLQLYNDKIYYLRRDDNDNWQLRRVNLDGTNDILMLKTDISEYCIVDDILYYVDNTYKSIYSINLDGTKKNQLTEDACSNLEVFSGRIFYTNLYDHGYVYSMKLDGSDRKVVISDNTKYAEKTDYKTQGIDDVGSEEKKEETKDVNFSADQKMTFEDREFEKFLRVMFNREMGDIYGSDLLSVQYIGYYEGAPTEISQLRNRGKYSSRYENSVLFSTQPFTSGINQNEVLCGDATGDTLSYRKNCTVVTVRSNEWMAEHVMPYLYYFKNLKWFTYGYCWIGNNVCLPSGADQTGINPHSRYFDDPYDPFYDDDMLEEYLNDIVGTWYCVSETRKDTLTITSGGKMYMKTEWSQSNTSEEYDLEYKNGLFTDDTGLGYECNLNQYGSMTVIWSNGEFAEFRRMN